MRVKLNHATKVLSDRAAALANPETHSFSSAKCASGYYRHRTPATLNPGDHPPDRCSPPIGTRDGTLHFIQPPADMPAKTMRWIAARKVWALEGIDAFHARRMGFYDTYLSRAGWRYVGTAP